MEQIIHMEHEEQEGPVKTACYHGNCTICNQRNVISHYLNLYTNNKFYHNYIHNHMQSHSHTLIPIFSFPYSHSQDPPSNMKEKCIPSFIGHT